MQDESGRSEPRSKLRLSLWLASGALVLAIALPFLPLAYSRGSWSAVLPLPSMAGVPLTRVVGLYIFYSLPYL